MNKFYLKSDIGKTVTLGNEHFSIDVSVERVCHLAIYVCDNAVDSHDLFDFYDLKLFCELTAHEPLNVYDNTTELTAENVLTTLNGKYYSIYVGEEIVAIIPN